MDPFFDGVATYNTANRDKVWTATQNSLTVDPANGPRGGPCLKDGWFERTFAAGATKCFTYRFKRIDVGARDPLISFKYLGNENFRITLNGDGTLVARRGGTILGVGSVPLAVGAYYCIEAKVKVDPSTGTVDLKVGGTSILSLSGVNTADAGNSLTNSIRCDPGNHYAADIGISDDFVGMIRVDEFLPSGNGNSSQLINSNGDSVNNFSYVDEVSPDDDTSYVQSATPGDKDTYAYPNISGFTPASIIGVQVSPCAKTDDAGARSINTVVRSGGADTDGAAMVIANSYLRTPQWWPTDPNTGSAWTASGFNAAEFGQKVAA
jgi:hypothetical protein